MCNFVELLDILVITTKSYCEKASIFSCLKKSCLGQKSSLKQLFTKHMFSCLTRSKQLNLSKKLFFLQKAKLPNTNIYELKLINFKYMHAQDLLNFQCLIFILFSFPIDHSWSTNKCNMWYCPYGGQQ